MDHDASTAVAAAAAATTTSVSCPMIMFFHGGHCERILWTGWTVSEIPEFVLSCFALLLMALSIEVLKFIREYVVRKEVERIAHRAQAHNNRQQSGENCCHHDNAEEFHVSNCKRIMSLGNITAAVLYFIQMWISYLVMLAFMTYNYWICLGIILGLGIGYFFFGWRREVIATEKTDCCS